MAGEEQQMRTQDEHYGLISMLYHLLKGEAAAGSALRGAQEAGDQELAQFFKDWQAEQRHFAERAKNLLGSRMAHAGLGARKEAEGVRELRDVTNANVNSGGNTRDDIVDEQSKESFPASDAPAQY